MIRHPRPQAVTAADRPRPRVAPLLPFLVALLAAAVAVAGARAEVPRTIAFQGFLSDDGGQPLDGTVELGFRIYASATGGAALWSETHAAVPVSRGVFAVALGSVSPLSAAATRTGPRYLGVTVDGGAELPRTELRATPFALRAQAADSVTVGIDIRQGSVSTIESTLDNQGEMTLTVNNRDGILAARLGADNTGDGVLVLFNFDHTASMRLDSGVGGDLSVRLPNGSINAVETGSEPGLASATNTGFTALTGTVSSILSRTITPPADGFVLALGQGVARISHTTGTATSGAIGLSDDGIDFGSAQDVNVIIPAGAPTGSYAVPVHVNGVFSAAASALRTIHLVGSETSGSIEVEDVSLTLLYVPTSYGAVTQTLAATDDGEDLPARGPQTPAEIAAEQEASRWADIGRLERELAALRAEHAARLAELEARSAAAGASR